MNKFAQYGGEAVMNLGAGFTTGAIVAQAFNPMRYEAYSWLMLIGLILLIGGFLLKFV